MPKRTIEKDAAPARLRNENGSITVLFAFLLPIMLLMFFLIADITQLVFDKIRLQHVADACALSGATVQSAGMNEIADLNHELRLELANLQAYLTSEKWRNLSEGLACVDYFTQVFRNLHRYQDEANLDFSYLAQSKAREVFAANHPGNRDWNIRIDPTPRGRLIQTATLQRPVSFRYVSQADYDCSEGGCSVVPVLYWNSRQAGDPEYYDAGGHDGREFSQIYVKWYLMEQYDGAVRVRRAKRNPQTDFGCTVTQFPTAMILGSKLFGYTPVLKATAVAKPTGGHIRYCRAAYRPVLIE